MPDYNTASATMNGNAFSPSSRNNPCPVCGRTKDGDCRIKPNNELVLCHNNFDNDATLQPDLWHYDGQTSDGRCGKYILKTSDRTQKPPRSEQTRYFHYPARDGSPLVRVRRIDTTSKKSFSQQRWNGNEFVAGLDGMNRAYIPIYRYAEVQEAIAQGQLIFIVEGETCADLLWSMGLAATTNIGGSGKWRDSDTDDLTGASVVICPDRDQKGIEHAEKLGQHFPKAQWLYCYPNSPKWDDPPEKDGLDIANWIADFSLKPESLIKFISPHARRRKDVVSSTTVSSEEGDNSDNGDNGEAIIVEKNYVQKAEDALYSDAKWVSIAGQLYRYTGQFYELQPDCLEQKRIAAWLGAYVERTRYGYAYQRAKARNVNEVFSWIVYRQAVDSRQINLDGLNCSNGVVQIFDDGTHTFKPHNPDLIFTYQGCKYDPKADSSDCDRLLECLEPAQREIFLRTAAAALALKLVRAKIGNIKGLLCHGSGSNGKDTLRTALAAVLGQGMTSKALQDFKAYDTGRKFCLAGLESSICNWASENSSAVKLDSIQSLKQFITGDPLDIERKGKDAYSYEPNSIFLGNCNELPTISSGLEAIRRRYAILTFNKTYKRNADPGKGELEADPRLKNDPAFVRDRIAPALLNKMLERIPLMLKEGINYAATDEAMRIAQEDSRHLWAFAREAGVEYDGTSKIYTGDLYKILEQWYLDNGWLTLDDSGKKPKKIWEAESPYDPPVKKSQDLYLRLREIFPHIERRMDTQERKGSKYIFGINLAVSSQPSQPSYTERVSSQPSSQLSSQPSQPSKSIQLSSQPLSNSSQPPYVERVSPQKIAENHGKSGDGGCDDGCDETLAVYDGCDGCDESPQSVDFYTENVDSEISNTESLYEQWQPGLQLFIKVVGNYLEPVTFKQFQYREDGTLLAIVSDMSGEQASVPVDELHQAVPATQKNEWETIISVENDRDGYRANYYGPGKMPKWDSLHGLVSATNSRFWGDSTFTFIVAIGAEKSFNSPRDWWTWRRDFCEKDWEKWQVGKTVLRVTAASGRNAKALLGSTGYFKGIRSNGKKNSKIIIGILDLKTKKIKDFTLELWQVQKV